MILRELVAALGLDFDQKSFDKGELALKRVKQVAVGIAGALAANAVVRGFARIVSESAEAADTAAKTAASIGLTTQAYQGLSHAAELSNVSQQEFNVALAQLSRQASDAAGGSKEAREAFAKFGVRVTDSAGRVRGVDQLLGDVADRFKNVKSPTERAALAMQLFGRSGTRMIPLLLEGKDGIKALAGEVEEFGATFTNEFAEQAEEFNDTLTRLRLIGQGVKNMIAAALLPTLQKLLDRFIAWRRENKDLIGTKLEQWAGALGRALEVVGHFAVAVGRVFAAAASVFGGFGAKVALVVAVLGGLVLALGWPVVLIGLLAAALVLIAEDILVFSRGGRSAIGLLIEKFKAWVSEFLAPGTTLGDHWIVKLLGDIVDHISTVVWPFLVDFHKRWIGGFLAVAGKVLEIVGDIFKGIAEAIGKSEGPLDLFKRLWIAQLDGVALAWKETFGRLFAWLWQQVQENAGAIGKALLEALVPSVLRKGIAAAVDIGGNLLGVAAPAPTASPTPAAAAAGRGGATFNMEIEVNGAPGQNEAVIADLTAQKIDEHLRATYSDAAAALTPAVAR